MKRIAIIGAGLSGIILGRELAKKAKVTVFEKAKGIGGRMSVRYADRFAFDHGTQSFTARTSEFQSFLEPFLAQGLIAPWHGSICHINHHDQCTDYAWDEPHFVPIPHMNSLCKALASPIDIFCSSEVLSLERSCLGWQLSNKQNSEWSSFDWVISTAPPVQTVKIFEPYLPYYHPMRDVVMESCYALMLGFHRPWDKGWIAAKLDHEVLQWIAVNSTKPGRDVDVTSLVVHSTAHWATAHVHNDVQDVQHNLIQSFQNVTGITEVPDYTSIHRWLYASTRGDHAPQLPYIDQDQHLAAVGDWCSGSHVEQVWLHTQSFAKHFLECLEG